jgi:Ferredoxin-dependent bilin reductase
MYPRPEYDLPILAMDMVGKDDRISLAVIDACPVAENRSLPAVYAQGIR